MSNCQKFVTKLRKATFEFTVEHLTKGEKNNSNVLEDTRLLQCLPGLAARPRLAPVSTEFRKLPGTWQQIW